MKMTFQACVFCLCACAVPGQGTTIVVPNTFANAEGNSSVNDFLEASSFRMQMVFDASQFASLSGAPGINSINSISFRIDGASTFHVQSVFRGSAIQLSTTTRAPDSLSPVFADNIGADVRTVYTGGVAFGGAYFAGSNPQLFGNSIIITSPFFYNPAQGNLLLDIIAGSGQVLLPGSLDAQSAVGDSISRVFANSAGATIGNADSLGLVTRFDIVVIPEPSTWLLALLGFGIAIVFVRTPKSENRPLNH